MNSDLLTKIAQLKEECIREAEAQDKERMQKCAQVILASTGLKLLKSKLGK